MTGISITQYDNFAWMPMVMSAVGSKAGESGASASGGQQSGGFDWMSMISSANQKPAGDPTAEAQARAVADATEAQSKAARFAGLFDFLKNKNQPTNAAERWKGLFSKDNTMTYIIIAAAVAGVALLLYFLFRSPKPAAA